ncbi:glycosyltransferase [Nocardioides ochotonae]|uniref:glycosyltransferase n=1 Tax=Nocardioides ochotonae TaxID=2685869 RepID=UPI00174DDAB4|nr:glycosyltransferase [Nocardioides ochotonae]
MPGLLVHEWISTHGGSENVLEVMASAYPDQPIAALWKDEPSRFPDSRVQQSWLAKRPALRQRKFLALPFMPLVWRRMDLSQYDSLLVSSHAFAHQIASNPTAPAKAHIYVHTPARYVWEPSLDARKDSPLLLPARAALRSMDRRLTSQTAEIAANSQFVAERIMAAWGREARVIHPPADVSAIQGSGPWAEQVTGEETRTLAALPDRFVLGASRFVRYKRLDLAVRVGELLGLPVVLAGSGEDQAFLEDVASKASVPIHFVHRPSDELLRALMESASLFVFPPIEDFGIMPVEAAALGTPSLVNRIGGAKESVEKLDGGAAVDFSDATEVRQYAEKVMADDYSDLGVRARHFSNERFVAEIREWRGE